MSQSNRLDYYFTEILIQIETGYVRFNKHNRIRIQQWTKKLQSILCNDIWKKNRNAYARLLLQCIQKDNLIEPFSKMPPQGSLPNLKYHEFRQQSDIISHVEWASGHQKIQRYNVGRSQYRNSKNGNSSEKKHNGIYSQNLIQRTAIEDNLRLGRYMQKSNILEVELEEAKSLIKKLGRFLKKYENVMDYKAGKSSIKEDYQAVMKNLEQYEKKQLGSHYWSGRSKTDIAEETEVRVFHSYDEIQNLKFGLSS